MIDMVKQAQKCGHYAKYILFDTWFSCPCIVAALKKECHLDTIAMVKKNQNIRYCYNGEMLDIKTIYSRCKKRPGRSKYLLSVVVDVVSIDENGCKITVPAKIVCVRNRSKKKEWLGYHLYKYRIVRNGNHSHLRQTLGYRGILQKLQVHAETGAM